MCGLEISEFEFLYRYYIKCQTNIPKKVSKPWSSELFFRKDAFNIKQPTKVDMSLKKKPNNRLSPQTPQRFIWFGLISWHINQCQIFFIHIY